MEEWKSYKLGDISEIKGGKRLPKGIGLITSPNSHPYIRIRDLGVSRILELDSSYEYVDDETQKQISRYIVDEGDILLSIVGTIGLTGIVGTSLNKANLTENCVKIVNLKGLDYKFLYYFLSSPVGQSEISKGIVGAVQPKLPIKNIQNITINLPSLKRQQEIASILSSIDDKIELNNRINHNLEEQAQALYKSWFVDFEPFKDGKFVDSELGMIPEGWSVVPFLSLAKLCSGGTPKTDIKEFWNGNIPFFTPKDVKGSTFCLITEKTISEPGLNNCNSRLYSPYTIFITARGTVGKLCMAGIPMAMNQTNYAICPSESIDPVVLYLITKQLILKLQNKANGAVFDAITTRDFEGEYILASTPSVLNKFAQIVRPIYERILQNDKQTLALAQYRDALLPQLMTGSLITNNL